LSQPPLAEGVQRERSGGAFCRISLRAGVARFLARSHHDGVGSRSRPQDAALLVARQAIQNVELVEVEDQTVYFDPDEEDGFPWISALQTYLILASGGKREQEAAAQIRPDLIAAAGGGTDRGVGGEPG
jgi:hypothetical protein